MSRGDSFDTFSGPVVSAGGGGGRYRAIRVDRNALAVTHPEATGTGTENGSAITVGGDVKVAEVLSRPEAVDLQVFIVELEGDGDYVALAERDAIVTYPPQHLAIEIDDWGDSHGGELRDPLDDVPFDDGEAHADHTGEDNQRRTAGDRGGAGRHAHDAGRRHRNGSQGGWVG